MVVSIRGRPKLPSEQKGPDIAEDIFLTDMLLGLIEISLAFFYVSNGQYIPIVSGDVLAPKR